MIQNISEYKIKEIMRNSTEIINYHKCDESCSIQRSVSLVLTQMQI